MNILTKRFMFFIALHALTGGAALYYNIELYVIGGIVLLWLMFIPTGLILTRHRERPLTGLRLWLAYIWGVVFVIADVIVNYTCMTYVFAELPDSDRKTVTERLKHYLRTEPYSWRGKIAVLMCEYLIEPWDFGHCAIK